MKRLSSREKTLAMLLGFVAFMILNLIFLPRLSAGNREGHSKHTDLKAQLAAAEAWIGKREYWAERKKWLEDNEPLLEASRRDSASQLEELQKIARDSNLKIEEVRLLQLAPSDFYQPVGAQLTLTGPWSGLVKFLSNLQQPDYFDVVPRFSVKSGQEPQNIRCELEVQRWFRSAEEDNQ